MPTISVWLPADVLTALESARRHSHVLPAKAKTRNAVVTEAVRVYVASRVLATQAGEIERDTLRELGAAQTHLDRLQARLLAQAAAKDRDRRNHTTIFDQSPRTEA